MLIDNIVTLDQLLNITDTIKANSKEQEDFNQLLDKCIVDNYDILENKQKLLKLFSRFKSARYLYDFPIEDQIKTTTSYEEKVGFTQRSNSSKVETAVQKYCDEQIHTTNVYYSILKVSYKLTGDEVVYLINTFLTHKSEDDIAELIGISKTYLQNIKKSCIVKMWVDLKKYCKEDD